MPRGGHWSEEGTTRRKMAVTCPYEDCGASFQLDCSLAGRKVRCSRCCRRFYVGEGPGGTARKAETSGQGKGDEKGTVGLPSAPAEPPPSEPAEDGELKLLDEPAVAAVNEPVPPSIGKPDTERHGSRRVKTTDEDSGDLSLLEEPVRDAGGRKRRGTLPDIEDMSLEPPTKVRRRAEPERPPHPERAPSGHRRAPGERRAQSVDRGDDAEISALKEEAVRACPLCGRKLPEGASMCSACAGERSVRETTRFERQTTFPVKPLVVGAFVGVVLIGGLVLVHRMRDRDATRRRPGSRASQPGMAATGDASRSAREVLVRAVLPKVTVTCDDGTSLLVRRGQPMVRMAAKDSQVQVEVWSPEKRVAGWVRADAVEEDPDAAVEDMRGGRSEGPREHREAVRSLCFRPDGRYAASLAERGTEVNVWHVDTGRIVRTYDGHRKSVTSVGFLQDGSLASVGSEGGGVRVWDPLTTATLRRVQRATGSTFAVSGGMDGMEQRDGQAWLWNLDRGELRGHSPEGVTLSEFRISHDGRRMLARTSKDILVLFDVPSFTPKKVLKISDPPTDFDLSPSGEWVAHVPVAKKMVRIDAIFSEESVNFELNAHPKSVRFSGNNAHIGVLLGDQACVHVMEFRYTDRDIQAVCGTDENPIRAFAFTAKGDVMATGHADGDVRFWSLRPGGKIEERTRTDVASPAAEEKPADDVTVSTPPDMERTVAEQEEPKRLYQFVRNFLLNGKQSEAEKAFRQLKQKYPQSPYTRMAESEMKVANEP